MIQLLLVFGQKRLWGRDKYLIILDCGGVSHCGVFRLPEPGPVSGAGNGAS